MAISRYEDRKFSERIAELEFLIDAHNSTSKSSNRMFFTMLSAIAIIIFMPAQISGSESKTVKLFVIEVDPFSVCIAAFLLFFLLNFTYSVMLLKNTHNFILFEYRSLGIGLDNIFFAGLDNDGEIISPDAQADQRFRQDADAFHSRSSGGWIKRYSWVGTYRDYVEAHLIGGIQTSRPITNYSANPHARFSRSSGRLFIATQIYPRFAVLCMAATAVKFGYVIYANGFSGLADAYPSNIGIGLLILSPLVGLIFLYLANELASNTCETFAAALNQQELLKPNSASNFRL
ncbi:MAG: hypothetical protein JJ969_10775 [Rhizobiaceae bacterium]|nr:hypothetical protein [Rhizobiaceae bacterium]